VTVGSTFRTQWERLFAVGELDGETESRHGRRRIVIGYFFFGMISRIFATLEQFSRGSVGWRVDFVASILSVVFLVVLWLRPRWFIAIVNVALFSILVEVLAGTLVLGGLGPSDLVVLYGLLTVVGALIVLPVRVAVLWALAFGITVALAVVLPDFVAPREVIPGSERGVAMNVLGVTILLFAGMAYFVRQRERFQRQSDQLLHNILPDQIATRLKAGHGMIADDFEQVSVLFADVVGFTPMSATMSPTDLVGLLNSIFTVFDGFVDDLGLEKIKTVGDEYMVAAGVPEPRADHAYAMAELAVRIRDHVAASTFEGHEIRLRIGINSGPVVAGVVGTHKFAYDLWGDVVNIASRMESEGIPGSIQVTPETYRLIADRYICEPRGMVSVKGRGEMETFILVGRRQSTAAASRDASTD
jgi:adenylate cyclase